MKQLYTLLFFCFHVFILHAQSTDLLIQKTGPVTIYLGEQMNYVITVSNSGTLVSNASFSDFFPSGVSNVNLVSCFATGGAICPSSSDYLIDNTSFTGTIPLLPHGSSVEFNISLNAPYTVNGATSISNTATVDVPFGFTELNPSTNSSTWNSTILSDVDLVTSITSNQIGSIGNCTNFPLTIDYEIFWTNTGPSVDLNTTLNNSINLSNIVFNGLGDAKYFFNYEISNVTWSSNTTNFIQPINTFPSLNDTLTLFPPLSSLSISSISPVNITQLNINDTIFLSYTLDIDSATFEGCGLSLDFNLVNTSIVGPGNSDLVDINSSNNSSNASSIGGFCDLTTSCLPIDIETVVESSNTNLDSCQTYPYTIDYEVFWTNNGLNAIDSGTNLSNAIKFSNVTQLSPGNTTYDFNIEVLNLNWSGSNQTMSLPNGNFPVNYNFPLPFLSNILLELENAFVDEFLVGDTFFLNYTLLIDSPIVNGCARSFSYDLFNFATFNLGLDNLIDTFNINNSDAEIAEFGYCDLESDCGNTDIETIVSNTPSINLGPCGEPVDINYQIQWINNGPATDYNTNFQNYLFMSNVNSSGSGNTEYGFEFEVLNMNWSSNDTSIILPSGNFSNVDDTVYLSSNSNFSTLLGANIPVFEMGDTITLSYNLKLDSPIITGCGRSYTYDLANGAFFTLGDNNLSEDNFSNNNDFVYNFGGEVSATDLAISESVNPAIVNHLDTTEITIIFQNASDVFTNNASWNQILPVEFNIIQSSINCSTTAGSTICSPVNYNALTNEISQNIPIMEANSTLEITFSGWVNSVNSITVNLEANASINCYDCVPQTNFTQTTFQIDGLCDLAYAGEISISASDCNGVADGQAIILTSGPYVGNLSYFWADSLGNLIPGSHSDTLSGLAPGGYSVTVIDDGIPGCNIQDSIYVACTFVNGPNILPDDTNTLEDEVVEILVLNNDTDIDGFIDTSSIDLDPSNIGIQDTIVGNNGIWYVTDDGNVIFIPNENFNGTVSISYVVTDNDGNSSNIETITVEVIPVNDEPQVNNDTLQTLINDTLTFDVFENDNDNIDSLGGIDTTSLQLVVGPSNGSVFIDSITGEITYIPNENFVGVDSFQYVLCDNGYPSIVLCDTAWVYIIISSEAQFVFVNSDTFYTNVNENVFISPLVNDSASPNSLTPQSLSIISEPLNGSISLITNTSIFIYEPNIDFYGVDSFQYVICDDGFLPICDTSTVYIYSIYFPSDPDCSLSFPEGISPNGDGLNDFWVIGNMECYPNHELNIFNRWGNTIFKTKKYQNNWKGQSNYDFSIGNNLPAGTYFYIFDTGKKDEEIYKGFIYLNK